MTLGAVLQAGRAAWILPAANRRYASYDAEHVTVVSANSKEMPGAKISPKTMLTHAVSSASGPEGVDLEALPSRLVQLEEELFGWLLKPGDATQRATRAGKTANGTP